MNSKLKTKSVRRSLTLTFLLVCTIVPPQNQTTETKYPLSLCSKHLTTIQKTNINTRKKTSQIEEYYDQVARLLSAQGEKPWILKFSQVTLQELTSTQMHYFTFQNSTEDRLAGEYYVLHWKKRTPSRNISRSGQIEGSNSLKRRVLAFSP